MTTLPHYTVSISGIAASDQAVARRIIERCLDEQNVHFSSIAVGAACDHTWPASQRSAIDEDGCCILCNADARVSQS